MPIEKARGFLISASEPFFLKLLLRARRKFKCQEESCEYILGFEVW
jgi:hypothetical protein